MSLSVCVTFYYKCHAISDAEVITQSHKILRETHERFKNYRKPKMLQLHTILSITVSLCFRTVIDLGSDMYDCRHGFAVLWVEK